MTNPVRVDVVSDVVCPWCFIGKKRLEQAIATDEEALHDPELFKRDPKHFAELTERIARHRAEIEAAELRWLEVAEMAEALAQ